MPQSKPRREVMFQQERPGTVGAHVSLESLGLTAGDPHNGVVLSQFFRAHRAGRDILDPAEQARCVEEGRRIYEESENLKSARVVYYVRIGKYIKIGTAVDLGQRMKIYPPDAELLATEPGHYEVEFRRLVEFREYLAARREWFSPGPRLMAHIDSLRSAPLADVSWAG